MRCRRFSAEQIIGVRKEDEAGAKVDELCRRHGSRRQPFSLAEEVRLDGGIGR